MIRGIKLRCNFVLLCAFAATFLGAVSVVKAAECSLADHIRSANTSSAVGLCPEGSGAAIITISEDIRLSEPLPVITGAITIEGGGHTISGNGQFRIFDVDGGSLTIRNVTLAEGRAEAGGAIFMQDGALEISGSRFVGNRSESSAGAIYASGGRLDISGSRFEDNCAQLASYSLVSGVDRDERSVVADGCARIRYTRSEIDGELQTNVDGGAIRLVNGVEASIVNTTFADNSATYGGAISTASRDDRLVISGSSFVGNRASDSGGAIGAVWTGGGTISISNSSFVKNAAENSGGALHAAENTVDISNSTFGENASGYEGGALHIGVGAVVTVTHATFFDDRARSRGDAISKGDGALMLRNSIVAGAGSAEDCAGGLDQSVGNLSPDRTCGEPQGGEPLLGELTGAPGYYPLLDYSPAVDGAAGEFCPATDQLGEARPQGGGCDIGAIESRTAKAAENETPAICSFADQIVAANSDRAYNGCPAGNGVDTIYLIRDVILSEALQPITSHIIIEGNGLTISGDNRFRIFDVDGGKLTVRNLTMTKGWAASDGGGAIRLQNGGRAVVSDSRFSFNSATGSGGGVFIGWTGAANSWARVSGSSFERNSASNGGAIYAGSGSISVSNSSFVENTARWPGSGAIGTVNSSWVDVVNSTFISNQPVAVSATNRSSATLTHVTIYSRLHSAVRMRADSRVTSAGRLNLRNSIVAGRGIDAEDCDYLQQNVGNLIEDGSCAPAVSGDPMLVEADGTPVYFDVQAASPVIGAAHAGFCLESDQIGRARAIAGRCDIGAIESIPARRALSQCTVRTTHGLNLRDEPNGDIVGFVPIRSSLAPLGRTRGWMNVEYEGVEGWISAEYVEAEGRCD